jgi:hypothetical protein
MAGLVPAIHVFWCRRIKDVDARDEDFAQVKCRYRTVLIMPWFAQSQTAIQPPPKAVGTCEESQVQRNKPFRRARLLVFLQ